MKLENKDLKWVGCDFDQTLTHNTGHPDYIPTVPLRGAREFMQELIDRDYKPIVYTARHWADYEMIEAWLNEYKIPFRRIICGKPLFRYIVDDRNIEFKGDYEEVLKKIE